MTKPLRLAFMGTPDFAASALQALIDGPHDIACVYTQPPRPKGRGQQVQKSAVHLLAEGAGIEVRHPINFKEQSDIDDFKALDLDVAVVAAYGLILPQSILDIPRHGCLNIHASLLPRWRGAAPIQRAIMAGDTMSGVTIMQMEKGLDTGPEILKKEIALDGATTAQSLHDDLAKLGANMIGEVLDDLAHHGQLEMNAQATEGVTYAHMLEKSEGRINWAQDAAQIDAQIRALNPWPGTWCETHEGKRLKIKSAHLLQGTQLGEAGSVTDKGAVICGDNGLIALNSVQPENKKPMDARAAMNGGYLKAGEILS